MRALLCLPLASVILVLLTACGGGGGGGGDDGGGNNPPPPPPQQFTIGGTVSGLHGEVVLQINGASDLSIAEGGDFTFPDSLEDGSTYEVTVVSSPKGQLCNVTAGSGTATANVTNVKVACADDPSAFYTVFTATGAATADVGLYAVYSKALGDDPVHVTDADAEPVGYSLNLDIDSLGRVGRGPPHAVFYVTRDVTGGDHVWGLGLSGRSALRPRQLSNATFANTSTAGVSLEGCARNIAYEDLTDPDSAFLLLELPPPGANCSGTAGHEARKLIRLTDAATDPGVDLPAGLSQIQALYAQDGKLSGFLALDDSGNLSFYADETFAHPDLLRPAIDAFEILSDVVSPLVISLDLFPTPSSLLVKLQRQDGSNAIFRIDHAGAFSSALYSWQGPSQITFADDGIFMYVSSRTADTNFMEEIAKIRLNGTGGSQVLYAGGPVTGANSPLYIVGTIDTQLILQRPVDVDPITSDQTAYIATLDLAAPAGTNVIFRSADRIQARLRANAIFLNTGLDAHQYSSAILSADGSVIQALTPNTAFVGSGLQVRDIQSSSGVGGGSFYDVSLSATDPPTLTAFKNVDGSSYTLPDGADLPFVRAITSEIAVGVAPATVAPGSLALTFDIDQHLVAPHPIAALDTAYSAIFF